jgi:hypothetical protein
MEEQVEIERVMSTLQPSPVQVEKIGKNVDARVERLSTPLFEEWVGMFRLRPLESTGLVLVGGAIVVLTGPLGGLLTSLLSLK